MFFKKFLNNTKGSILPVTVTAMVVIMVAGLACLRTFSYQNKLNNLDKTKIRLQYAAEGAVEICRSQIGGGDFLSHNVTSWTNYDTGSYPTIQYLVSCAVNSTAYTSYGFPANSYTTNYVITGQARASVVSPDDGKTRTLSCVVRYFFAVDSSGGIHFIGWAKDPITIA